MMLSSEPFTFRGCRPSYSMKPSLLNLFKKKLTRDRVVAFADKIPSVEHRDHGFFAGLREHRQPDSASLNVHHIVVRVSLRENGLASSVLLDGLGDASRREKCARVERPGPFRRSTGLSAIHPLSMTRFRGGN
jgi:hypothetical protein